MRSQIEQRSLCVSHELLHEASKWLLSKPLGEDVGDIVECWHVFHDECSELSNVLPYEVMFDIDMFDAAECDEVLRDGDGGLIVAQQRGRLLWKS